jgi:hypothetical protein
VGQTLSQPDARALRLRQVADDAMEEERGFVEQALRRSHVLQQNALGHRAQLLVLVRAQVTP